MKNKYSLLCFFICVMSATVFAQSNSNLQCSLLDFPKVIKQNQATEIKVLISDSGKEFKEDITAHFAIDDTEFSSKNIQLTILPQKTQEISINYNVDLPAAQHKLKVWFTDKLNNQLSSINTIETDFLVARTTVPQLPLIEEFTSSTCGPCASFNNTFDPFLSSINANENSGQAAAVKYQMNWPAPGDDPSFNPDGNSRRGFYAVTGIPKSYLNGVSNSIFNQSVIDAASGQSAFSLVPYFYLSGDTVKATGTVKPYTTMTTALRVHLALTEDFYTYTGGTTSQTTFHYVMRKMLPSYVGTIISNINEDTIYTINRNYKVTYDTVVTGSNNIWGTSAGFTLVSWIQNASTKEVYQAAFANTPSALNITENASHNSMEVFPNPANEIFTIKLELTEKAAVVYTLNDITGKEVQAPVIQELPAGKHILQTSTQNLLPGIYICTIRANDTTFTERVMVTR